MQKKFIASALAVVFAGVTSSSAALVTTTAGPVTILGNDYFVTFNKLTQASTTFNDVYGSGSPVLTFTNVADAETARNAIVASVPAANYDPFGLPTTGFAGFFVPFVYSTTGFNRVGANYLVPNGPAFLLAAPNNNDAFGRTQSFNFSFVTFAAVPEPTAMAVVPALGLLTMRRRARNA